MKKKLLALLLCVALMASIVTMSTPVFADEAKTEVAGARWFPCETGRENDMLWEAECLKDGCGCQAFDADPNETGHTNFLNTTYGEDGSLTLTRARRNNDDDEFYWPRVRTLMLDSYPKMDITTANTLYFDLEAVNCQWNLCIGINGSIVMLSKYITAACGGAALESTGVDGVAGTYKGSINLTEVFADIIATENGTESWVGAKAFTDLGANAQVPQIQIFYVGVVDPNAYLKINELYISTPADTEGANCEYMDMGTIYGDEFYGEGNVPSDQPTDTTVTTTTTQAPNLPVSNVMTKDGVEVTLTADKTRYVKGDAIQVTVNAKNTNTYDLYSVSLESVIPEGYTVASGHSSVSGLTLAAGESKSLSVVYREGAPTTTTVDREKEDTPKSDSPKTGDTANTVLMLVLALTSVGGVVWAIRAKKTAQMLSVVLCLVIVCQVAAAVPVVSVDAAAASLSVSVGVTVDQVPLTLVANVAYDTEKPTEATNAPTTTVTSPSTSGAKVELPDTPITLMQFDVGGAVSARCDITDMRYEIVNDKLRLYFTGEKTYDRHGESSDRFFMFNLKITDSEGYSVYDSGITTSKMTVGDKFKDLEKVCFFDVDSTETYTVTLSNHFYG